MDEVGGMLRAVGRHEIGPHVVVGAPYVDVVDEGIGDLGGGNESQGAILVTVERFGETLSVDTTIVEPAREAVIRHDVGEVLVGQPLDVANAVGRLAPKLFCAMVAVLDDEGSFIDGFIYRVASGTPVGEVRHGLWDIVAT